MEGRVAKLRERFEDLLNETTEAAAELVSAERATTAIPHYREIETAAHRIGRRLSCRIQTRCANEVAAGATGQGSCPTCGARCDLSTEKRTLDSTDGPVEVIEPVGQCDRCRRSFFPSAPGVGSE